MRFLNGRQHSGEFTDFMQRVQAHMEQRSHLAAEERRCATDGSSSDGPVLRPTPLAASMRQLHDQISAEMCEDPDTAGKLQRGEIKIPSLSAFTARMVPGHPHWVTSDRYSGEAGIRFAVQRRTARKQHPNAHYNNAQGKLLREYILALK
jgi:hypothetical protein